MRKSKVYSISDNDFRELIKNSFFYSDVIRALGLVPKGGSSFDALKKRILDLDCDVSHFKERTFKARSFTCNPLSDILVENSTYTNTGRLKKRLLDSGMLEYKCSECGNCGIWQNKKLVLQLDHINGINNDNRLCNLRLLCPNCHSQTTTYSGKNKNL